MDYRPPKELPALKTGITYTRDFEIVEMSEMGADKSSAPFTTTTSYAVSTAPKLPTRYDRQRTAGQNWVDSFRRVRRSSQSSTGAVGHKGYYVTEGMDANNDRFYDLPAANARIANSALVRDLKGRHLQMIAIGGSIGKPLQYLLDTDCI